MPCHGQCWDSKLSCVVHAINQPAISKIFLLLLIALQGDHKTESLWESLGCLCLEEKYERHRAARCS